MMIELSRLKSLIEFAQEAARLKLPPTHDVSTHEFCAFEHTFQGLPGIRFNNSTEGREVWLAIDRLSETAPPAPENQELLLWLQQSDKPTKKPELRKSIQIEIPKNFDCGTPAINHQPSCLSTQFLENHEYKSRIESLFLLYLTNKWQPWASDENERRQTIKLYNDLFKLKQQLEGSIGDDQVEMIWGIGMVVGKIQDRRVSYPLLTLAAHVEINDKTMALEIGPRDADDQLEIDIFMSYNNPGAVDLERAYHDFTKSRTQTLSPFDRNSFESILRAAAQHLDAEGVYWPEQTTPDDRTLPSVSKELRITDTWVLMMRPRSKSIMIQDLKRFQDQLDDNPPVIPGAVRSLLVEPPKEHSDINWPSFRGLSLLPATNSDTSSRHSSTKELYFPLPFNEQQAQIIQFLEYYDGVVVQGPPGTGKTHTIANVISHYLALGKRVLVTSMKEPALSVLKEKLPLDLQPLAISLLMNEQEVQKAISCHSLHRSR